MPEPNMQKFMEGHDIGPLPPVCTDDQVPPLKT
jgi:hypothetical protein